MEQPFRFIDLCVLYAALHFVGDFAFQSAWMAMEKGKNKEVLLYHCLTYTAPFALAIVLLGRLSNYHPNILSVLIIFLSHIAIDTCSARLKVIKTVWGDQLWHLSVLGGLLGVGWL
ncbi:MAG: DUF3307 domain-containing protein [Patescibacteria group bacterium]